MPNKSRTLYAFAYLLLSPVTVVLAQSPLSKIVGTVTDPRAAVIVGATATVKNEQTGYSRSAVTDERGYYEIDKLPDGSYTVDVATLGFKSYTQQHIVLETRQTMRIDVSLQVGEVTQRVEVVGEAPVVTTDTGQITSGQVNRKVISNNYLPQISNIYVANASYLSPSFQEYQAVGSTAAQNKTTVDGVEMNNFFLNVDTLQEVKVLTSGNSAEYASPVVMDFVTQSGTNALHGRFLMQLGNPAMNALGPNASIRGPGWPTSRDQLWSASGPVWIPKIYNGKDKTFFYIDRYWQSNTSYNQGAAPITIPPEAMRTGDFSFIPPGTFQTGALVNPFGGTPFPNNQIPASLISPLAASIQKFLPGTNYPSQNPRNDGPNYVRNLSSPNSVASGSVFSLKVDHQLTKKDRIGWASTWRRADSTSDRSQINFWWEKNRWPSNSQRAYWTRIIKPNVINEFRAGIERKDEWEGADPSTPVPTVFADQFKGNGIDFMKAMGFAWIPGLDPTTSSSLPLINIGGQNWQTGSAIGYQNGFNFRGGYDFRIDTRHFADNLSWIHGAHSFKMGGDLRPAYNQTIKWGQATAGQFDFTGRFSGHPYADFLLGLPDNSLRSGVPPRPYRMQKWGGVFFQDSWRATPRLTLELGLRYEHNGLAYEKNHMMSNFDPKTGSIVVPDDKALALVSPAFPSSIPVKTAAQVGFPLLLRNRPQFNWFPRVGFAYRPMSKTVVRGSFGFFSVPPAWEAGGGACCAADGSAMATTVPFALDEAFSNSVASGSPAFGFPYPFPRGTGTVPGQTALGVNVNFPFAYTANWNFTIEREVLPNTALRVSYLGVKGTNLPYKSYLSPGFGAVQVYPNFSRVVEVDAGANMSYQGMEASLKRRFSAGMQFEAFYSWGHKLSLPTVVRPWRETDFGDFIEDPRNRDRDRGRAPDWADQRLTISHVIELPFGRGKKWLHQVPRPVDYALGGWNLSGFWWFNTWKPITPLVSGQDPLGLGRAIRPNVVPGCNPNISPTISSVFNASCFTRPVQGEYGNAAWDSILPSAWVGLGQNYVALYKDLSLLIRESARLRIGGKVSNLFNHPYLVPAGGSNSITSGIAGRGAKTGARSMLVEAKIEF